MFGQVDADTGAPGQGFDAAAGRHLPQGGGFADNGKLTAVADAGTLVIGGAGGDDDLSVYKETQVVGGISGLHKIIIFIKQEQF